MKFEAYFSFEAIVGDLIRWRVKGKGTRDENGRRDVEKVLPARKAWCRAGVKDRKGVAPEVVRRQAIWRTVRKACGDVGECCQCGNVASANVASSQLRSQRAGRPLSQCGADLQRARCPLSQRWVQNLMKLVDEVQGAVFSGKVVFEEPKMFKIAKGRARGAPETFAARPAPHGGGVMQYREVASFERLADRVILSRMTAYVRDRLEEVLGAHCYSFRKDCAVNHQLAVKHLQAFRERFPAGSLFVAECDIKKFFDSISHEVVRQRWREVGFEDAAGKVLEAYLRVYAVGNGRDARCPRGGGSNGRDARCPRGLPQGGSFSTVLANLVLAEADRAVARVDDGRLFYARYCDDVVFVHPDEAMCRCAMDAYAAALTKLDLPLHAVRPFVYRPVDGLSTEYYSIKSKGPFRWREAEKGEADCAPWVSFLGSQVRYDGETRIRKESIEKHIRSLGRETAKAVRELQGGVLADQPRPVIREWFGRFRNGLIAKGVGYVTAKVKDCDMCWAGAFPNVTDCAETKMQMRRLDRVREGMLAKVASMLPARYFMTGHRYKGRPFSYFGFLEKAVRPTNMARQTQIHILPYSEL